MSTSRWSLRLPRTRIRIPPNTNLQSRATTRIQVPFDANFPPRVTRVHQRRWIQKPPPRTRPWARMRKKDGDGQDANKDLTGRNNAQGEQAEGGQQPNRNAQLATVLAEANDPSLNTPVHIPHNPHGVLPPQHPALSILGNSSLIIQRQMEMMNILMGFEQANRYVIMNGHGETIGYIAERDHGIGSAMARQFMKTHRSFTTHIFDKEEREVLRIHRPFAYINSTIRIYDALPEGGYIASGTTALQGDTGNLGAGQAQVSPLQVDEMRIIGEAQQQWAPLRRKYNLFSYRPIESPGEDDTPRIESGEKASSDTTALTESKSPSQAIEAGMTQFAHVNEPLLSWDFTLRNESQATIGTVNKNMQGLVREIFTDTSVYALRMDSAAQQSALEGADGQEIARYEREATSMTLDQRAVMLATAVSIDFDYFSRHSSHMHGGFMPMWFPGMGGGAAEDGAAAGGAAAGEAGAVGAAEGAGAMEGAAGAASRVGGAAGVGEGAIAGAGTMAGYEAMQRGAYGARGGQPADDASPTSNEPFQDAQGPEQSENRPGSDDVWGESSDPWGRGGPGDGPPPDADGMGGGGGGEGGGWLDSISEFFGD